MLETACIGGVTLQKEHLVVLPVLRLDPLNPQTPLPTFFRKKRIARPYPCWTVIIIVASLWASKSVVVVPAILRRTENITKDTFLIERPRIQVLSPPLKCRPNSVGSLRCTLGLFRNSVIRQWLSLT